MIEITKAIILGILEGITEWLPISSTGHMILLNDYLMFRDSPAFYNLFLVVIQLGAIMAVLGRFQGTVSDTRNNKIISKIIVALIPIIIIGLLFNDFIEKYFQTKLVISLMLILYGIIFIIVEKRNNKASINSINELSYKKAFILGCFQALAIIPGTSRSGVTIIFALVIGISRTTAAEFTFLLSIPTMLGASLLKLYKYGFSFSNGQICLLLVGSIIAFLVSLCVINFFMKYIKKHDFKIFGYYRIILGLFILGLLCL